jgi:hypothetical protein
MPPLLTSHLIGGIAAASCGLDMLGCSTLDTSSHDMDLRRVLSRNEVCKRHFDVLPSAPKLKSRKPHITTEDCEVPQE